LVPQHQQQVPGLLGDPATVGVGGHASEVDRRVSSSMTNSTSSRRSHTVSTVKQVAGEDPGDLLAQERPPGAGASPAASPASQNKHDQRDLDRTRLTAASSARSAGSA
jgi:hypothetical protein